MKFKEIQSFRQWWLWLIIFITLSFWAYFRFIEVNQISTLQLLVEVVLMLVIVLLFLLAKLTTIIDEQGIQVKFFPFHIGWRTYQWKDIQAINIRDYNPLQEYGGFGIRHGLSGKAYNVSGRKGIYINFKNNKKLLIGTQKYEQVTAILAALGVNK